MLETWITDKNWKTDSSHHIKQGQFIEVLENFLEIVSDASEDASWFEQFDSFLQNISTEHEEEEMLCLGMAALALFIRSIWTGPNIDGIPESITDKLLNQASPEFLRKSLLVEDSVIIFVKYPQLLDFAQKCFDYSLTLGFDTTVTNLWRMRGFFIQQQLLDDLSPSLFDKIKCCILKLPVELTNTAECRLEIIRIYTHYRMLELAQGEMDLVQESLNFSYYLTGVLGKRTKFQTHNVAQLLCSTKSSTTFPDNSLRKLEIPVEDDLRLKHMEPLDPSILENEDNLHPLEYAFLLATLFIRRRSLANHDTHNLENLAIVERLFRGNGPWSMFVTAQLLRLQFMKCSTRNKMELVTKLEWMNQEISKSGDESSERLEYFFLSYFPRLHDVLLKQAELHLEFQDFKTASCLFTQIHKWDRVIDCCIELNDLRQAESIIMAQLQKEPDNPALWAYLGDVTGSTEHYEKALNLSKDRKSARVQRHYGMHYFKKKQFVKAIKHFQESLDLNSLQIDVWEKMGWAAIVLKQYELGVMAYKRYCTLENDNYAAWSNLAFCYTELGDLKKAILVLGDALKVDNSSWKAWDSLSLLQAQIGDIDGCWYSYQTCRKLKPNHMDKFVLTTLVKAHKGNPDSMKKSGILTFFKDLIEASRLTTYVGRLFIELVEKHDEELSAMLQLHNAILGVNGWERDEEYQLLMFHVLSKILEVSNQVASKKMFILIAKPAVVTVLKYDPENKMFGILRRTLEEDLESNACGKKTGKSRKKKGENPKTAVIKNGDTVSDQSPSNPQAADKVCHDPSPCADESKDPSLTLSETKAPITESDDDDEENLTLRELLLRMGKVNKKNLETVCVQRSRHVTDKLQSEVEDDFQI